MHNPESVLENEKHKILWDFEIQTDHLMPARWPNLVNKQTNKQIKKWRSYRIVDFVVHSDWPLGKTERMWNNKYLPLAREKKNDETWKWRWCQLQLECLVQSRKGWYRDWGTGKLEDSIVEKTKKSTGDLERLAVSQTPVDNHQLTLVWKTQ